LPECSPLRTGRAALIDPRFPMLANLPGLSR